MMEIRDGDSKISLLASEHAIFENVEEGQGPDIERCTYDDDMMSRHNISNLDAVGRAIQRPPSLLHKNYKRLKSNRQDELRQFRTSLRCWGLDQYTKLNIVFSWLTS
jgi:hypothetical protein